MSDFPDFSEQNYRIERSLGHNPSGGRVTYLATDTTTNQRVVIKQFQFAKSGSSWLNYDAYDREIQILKELHHPGIPKYLNAFQTLDGFCMVQEYIEAESLAASRSFNPEEIRPIAIAALEILVYLQNRIPPVIHRDIKPDNILVDSANRVYLVDFGFARVGEGEVGVSSVVKGTLGFMPPEQLFNRQLTEASDLYGLGMTLICLLTGTKADRIGDLVDISYRVSFKHLAPKINIHWVNWLEKMVEPRLKDRYPNAIAALSAVPTLPLRPPEAQFSQTTLEFHANRHNQQLTQTVVITNPIPDTTLEGTWEVAHHPHDPAPDRYQWIAVTPKAFLGNQVTCQVNVNTSQLMAGKTYQRRLLLQANTLAKTYPLQLNIHTLRTPRANSLLPYGLLLLLCGFAGAVSWLAGYAVLIAGTVTNSIELAWIGALIGVAIGLEASAWLLKSSGIRTGASACTLTAVVLSGIVLTRILTDGVSGTGSTALIGAGIGGLVGATVGTAIGTAIERLTVRTIKPAIAIALALTTALLGSSIGLSTAGILPSVPAMLLLTGNSLLLLVLGAHLQLQRMSANLRDRQAERDLIKP
jgi:serine/threonine protein kinase